MRRIAAYAFDFKSSFMFFSLDSLNCRSYQSLHIAGAVKVSLIAFILVTLVTGIYYLVQDLS